MPDASQLVAYARLLRLTPVEDLDLAPQATAAPPVAQAAPIRRLRAGGLLSFLLLVVVPPLLMAGYFWGLAADRYESEARFVLRTPGLNLADAGVGSLLKTAGITRANDDGYIVREYLESRDAMLWLEKNAALKAAFAVAKHDPIWRFPNLFTPDNQEGLYWHFQRMVSASFDSTTGVSTLDVQAFTPADAQRLATSLLDGAEALVNRLNERARRDAIEFAQEEVDRMQKRVLAAQTALTAFRTHEQLVDPGQVTLAVVETIAKLALEASQVSVQIDETTKSSPRNPRIATLRTRRAAIETQIAAERRRLAGNAQSIAPRIAEYERLMLEHDFAQHALVAAMTAAETARLEAQRRQVYLERIAQPSRPDYPAYPWRIIWTLTTLTVGYMTYRIWRILVADALRHIEP